MARGQEIRQAWARDNAEMHDAPRKARSIASRMYAGGRSNLVDASTRAEIGRQWASERTKKKVVRRRRLRKRGDEE
jgi:hypothetical protein